MLGGYAAAIRFLEVRKYFFLWKKKSPHPLIRSFQATVGGDTYCTIFSKPGSL